MWYLEWLLVPLALFMCLQYGLGPIMVYRNQRMPDRYSFSLLEGEGFLSDRGLAFSSLHYQVQQQGFRYAGSSELKLSHSVIYFSVYYSERRKLCCSLMAAHATHCEPLTSVEFTQMYSDGTLLNVNNTAVFGVYPEWEKKVAYRFPHVSDLVELLDVAERIIKTRNSKAEPVAMVDGKEFEAVESHLNEELDRLIKLGWVSSRLFGGERRLTMKGAVLMTWKMCWPIKFILNQRDVRRSMKVLKNL